jgi:ribosome maturation factor RimP
LSKAAEYEAKTEALLKPIAAEKGVEIYDVEYVKEGSDWILRAYIDKEGGVNIGDCEAVTLALVGVLDENEIIAEAYTLEVSSPGLGRQLKKDKHLEKSLGAEVEIKTYKPIEHIEKKKEFVGKLISFDKDKITIDNEKGESVFNRADIAMIRLKFDF